MEDDTDWSESILAIDDPVPGEQEPQRNAAKRSVRRYRIREGEGDDVYLTNGSPVLRVRGEIGHHGFIDLDKIYVQVFQ